MKVRCYLYRRVSAKAAFIFILRCFTIKLTCALSKSASRGLINDVTRGTHQQELTETKYDEKGLTAKQNLSNPESSSARYGIGHRNLFSRFLRRAFSRVLFHAMKFLVLFQKNVVRFATFVGRLNNAINKILFMRLMHVLSCLQNATELRYIFIH